MPVDDECCKTVQGKVQDLLSERHEKPTLKIVVEAVVEGVKLYRSYKEEKAAEAKRRRGKGNHKRHRKGGEMGEVRKDGHGNSYESSERRQHRRHRSRSRDEERGRHHRSPRDDRHSRSRPRHRDESRGKRYERSRSRDRRPRSRRRNRDNDVLNPVLENSPNNDSKYQMTGGAGPAGTLHDGHRKPDAPLPGGGERPRSSASGYQTSWRDLTTERKKRPASRRRAPTPYRSARRPSKGRSRVRSHSHSHRDTSRSGRKRSRTPHRPHRRKSRGRSSSRRCDDQHNKQSNLRPGRVGASRSPTRRQKGPDGTPFGSLPERKSKAGFGHHFMNTYRHIKAEHEAGYRSKGKLEKALDEMRKKKTGTIVSSDKQTSSHTREREKIRKSEPERVRWAEKYPGKTRGDEWKPRAVETEAWERHRREEEEHRRRKEDSGRRKKYVDQKNTRSSPVPEIRLQSPTSTESPRRQPPPVACELSHLPPPNHPPHWQHVLPQQPLPIREEEALEREVSPPRELSIRGADDRSGTGAAASYYDQAPLTPMPGGYEENEEAEYDQPEAYDEVPRPDTPPYPPYPDVLPSSIGSDGSSDSSSLIMSHAPQAASLPPRSTPTFLQSIPMPTPQQSAPSIPPPPAPAPPQLRPPPAPPLPAARPPNSGGIAALLGEIEGGFKLRKVADSDKRDNSSNPRAGKVVYEETAHSHDVEEHERAQAREANNQPPFQGNSTWSTRISVNEEDDLQPAANRAFQTDLAKALQARGSGLGTDIPTTGPRRGSDDSSLTAGSRTSMIANVSRRLQDEIASVQRLSKSESGEDLIFTLAAHVAQPGWNFDGPSRG